LIFVPAVVAVTLTEKEHDVLAPSVAPEREILLLPEVAEMVPPSQDPASPFGVATTTPEGRASPNATPVSDVAKLGFVIVKAREVLLLRRRKATPNCLVMLGGATTTMLALAEVLVPPLVDVTTTELFLMPALVPVTLRETEQLAPAEMVPPVRLREPAPAVATAVPPQLELRSAGVDTTKPDGRKSVNATPVCDVDTSGFAITNVREVVPPAGMVVAPNALVIDGGDTAMAGLAYPATTSVAASHIIGAHFPAKRGVRHACNIRRLEICT
jgi:hypothetical protein